MLKKNVRVLHSEWWCSEAYIWAREIPESNEAEERSTTNICQSRLAAFRSFFSRHHFNFFFVSELNCKIYATFNFFHSICFLFLCQSLEWRWKCNKERKPYHFDKERTLIAFVFKFHFFYFFLLFLCLPTGSRVCRWQIWRTHNIFIHILSRIFCRPFHIVLYVKTYTIFRDGKHKRMTMSFDKNCQYK